MNRIVDWLPDDTAALVYTDVNRQYLTGFRSSLGYLLISKNDSCLFVDGRYILAAKGTVKNCRVELFHKASDSIKGFLKANGINTVFCEDTVTVAQLGLFRKMSDGIDVTADCGLRRFIEQLRMTKTQAEVDCIVKAQRIAERAFQDVLDFIRPGVTERDIAAELEYRMKKYGSEIPSFDTIAVSGRKSAMPHGVPDDKVIENGDFITMDFGAVYNGYHSDMTRTVAVGHATDKMQLVYDTVLKAQTAAESVVKAGVKCSEVDKAARDVITSAGFGDCFTHSTGHAVGLEIHEQPSLSYINSDTLKAGFVVTDEPGIYIENEFGVRIEDMLLVKENGSQNLTKCEKSLIILR